MQATRRFAVSHPKVWNGLLEKLATATVHFLGTLVREGADAYQLFDSWAGMLTAEEYDKWAQPWHKHILAAVTGVPRILFVKECPYLPRMVESGADVISLGKCHDLAAALRDYPKLAFQGNVDEELLRSGTPEQVAEATRACVAAGGGRRHIVNLNHGVDKATPRRGFRGVRAGGEGEVIAGRDLGKRYPSCTGGWCVSFILVPKLRLGTHVAKLRFASTLRASGTLKDSKQRLLDLRAQAELGL